MEAWVGIEPTRHGFANRSLSHSSTTPCCLGNIFPLSEKTSPKTQKNTFFSFFSPDIWIFWGTGLKIHESALY